MEGRGTDVPGGALPERLRSQLRTSDLIPAGSPLVVALSGGLDSTALLHLFRFPLRDHVASVRAVHVDHAMRPDSRTDAAWVRGLCRAWGVPLDETRLDPPPRSEAEARTRRYGFLEDAAPADAVLATAHHRDDQAETVLFRAARGTGVRGLRGIAPLRGRVARPLLPYRRAELMAYAGAAGLAYREDPTNQDVSLARNRIRHRVLPELERVHPGAVDALARLAQRARSTERALDHALHDLEQRAVVDRSPTAITLARSRMLSYDPALRARLLRRLLRYFGSTPDRAGTHAALEFISSGRSGGQIHVAGGVRIERDFDAIRVARHREDDGGGESEDEPLTIPGPGAGSGQLRIGGRTWAVAWGPGDPVGQERAAPVEPVFPLTVRGWRPGDRIRMSYGSKKLKKLLAEARLDRRARGQVPVVVDGAGRVVWVIGVARAAGVAERGEHFEIAVTDADAE